MNRKKFMQDKEVQGFIHYLANIINGKELIEHGYYDRKIRRNIFFIDLHSAFKQYHWNKENYEINKKELVTLSNDIRAASSEKEFIQASFAILKWGAGSDKLSLYKHNAVWIKETAKNESVKTKVERALGALLSDTPSKQLFGTTYRMNAGFTKIYALMAEDEFIIYDSRVAAALAFLLVKYCIRQNKNTLPSKIRFTVAEAQGQQCRNPSISDTNLTFAKWGCNQESHAESNIIANWILCAALKKAKCRGKSSNKLKTLREVEAALFMVGYDFPQFTQPTKRSTEPKGSKPKTKKTINIQTKKDIARAIYTREIGKESSRKVIIDAFIIEAHLTPKGASTYYQIIRKEYLTSAL